MWCCLWFLLRWWPHLIHVSFLCMFSRMWRPVTVRESKQQVWLVLLTLEIQLAVCELCSDNSSVSTGVPVWHQSICREPRSQIWHMGSVCTHVCDTCFSSSLCFLIFFFLITAIETMEIQRMHYWENLLGMLVSKIPQYLLSFQYWCSWISCPNP